MTGIRSVEDLRDRCHVDEDTGCWHWRGAHSKGQPKLWWPPQQKVVTLGYAIAIFQTGRPPRSGHVWMVRCATKDCANPAHRRPVEFGVHLQGVRREPITSARIAAAKRASSKLSADSVAAIRASDETCAALGQRYGVSGSLISQIRQHVIWRSARAPGSSVFAQ